MLDLLRLFAWSVWHLFKPRCVGHSGGVTTCLKAVGNLNMATLFTGPLFTVGIWEIVLSYLLQQMESVRVNVSVSAVCKTALHFTFTLGSTFSGSAHINCRSEHGLHGNIDVKHKTTQCLDVPSGTKTVAQFLSVWFSQQDALLSQLFTLHSAVYVKRWGWFRKITNTDSTS